MHDGIGYETVGVETRKERKKNNYVTDTRLSSSYGEPRPLSDPWFPETVRTNRTSCLRRSPSGTRSGTTDHKADRTTSGPALINRPVLHRPVTTEQVPFVCPGRAGLASEGTPGHSRLQTQFDIFSSSLYFPDPGGTLDASCVPVIH